MCPTYSSYSSGKHKSKNSVISRQLLRIPPVHPWTRGFSRCGDPVSVARYRVRTNRSRKKTSALVPALYPKRNYLLI